MPERALILCTGNACRFQMAKSHRIAEAVEARVAEEVDRVAAVMVQVDAPTGA